MKPKYCIGERVFHALPEGPEGIVTDVIFRYSTGQHEYEVSFDPIAPSLQYQEFELSKERKVI